MSLKKSIAWIMGIVLLLTVVSGAFLYNQGKKYGGVSSTNEPRYDHILDTSIAYNKSISAGARNGSINTIGASCYEYSEIILTATLNQNVDAQPVTLVKPNSDERYVFSLQIPLEITFLASGGNFEVYFCWQPFNSDPDVEDPVIRTYLGKGRDKITLEEFPEGYGGEEGCIEVRVLSTTNTVHLTRMVVQMVPQTYSSGVTSVVAVSKNLLDPSKFLYRDGSSAISPEGTVTFPKGKKWYVYIPVDLPPGAYAFSYSGSNEFGDSVGRYRVLFEDGTESNGYESGSSRYYSQRIVEVRIYKNTPDISSSDSFSIENIQMEEGSVCTEYTPFFEDKTILTIPSSVTSLPGYGVGSGSLYNYIDLKNGVYVQTCKLVGADVVALDEPKCFDISSVLPPGSGNIDLYGVGALIFLNLYDEYVPSEVAYRRLIN